MTQPNAPARPADAPTGEVEEREGDDVVMLRTTAGMLVSLDEYNRMHEAERALTLLLADDRSIARPYVCSGCGSWHLVPRCTNNDAWREESPEGWRCHKQAGHSGECSTHMDCGAIAPNDRTVCGLAPDHDGPHGWESRLPPPPTADAAWCRGVAVGHELRGER